MHTTLRVDDRIRDRHVLRRIPVGTVIRDAHNTWTKESPDIWTNAESGARWRDTDLAANGTNRIVSFPSGAQTYDLPQETVEQIKWNFRVGALAAATSHGVGRDTVERTLAEMGIGAKDMAPTLGAGVRVDNQSMNDLPDGSTVYSGSPNALRHFSVQTKKAGRWVTVLGERSRLDTLVTVQSVAGDLTEPGWLTREGTEEDVEAIQDFKARAWRVGYALKRSQGWCSTYESIVHGLGVTEADLHRTRVGGFAVGDRVQAPMVAALPVGTLLMWINSTRPDEWGLYVRDDTASNTPQTRRVAGVPDSNENYHRYMTVVAIPANGGTEIGWSIPGDPARIWAALPGGTVFTYGGGGDEFVKTRDGLAVDRRSYRPLQNNGTYSEGQFGTNPNFTVRGFLQ